MWGAVVALSIVGALLLCCPICLFSFVLALRDLVLDCFCPPSRLRKVGKASIPQPATFVPLLREEGDEGEDGGHGGDSHVSVEIPGEGPGNAAAGGTEAAHGVTAAAAAEQQPLDISEEHRLTIKGEVAVVVDEEERRNLVGDVGGNDEAAVSVEEESDMSAAPAPGSQSGAGLVEGSVDAQRVAGDASNGGNKGGTKDRQGLADGGKGSGGTTAKADGAAAPVASANAGSSASANGGSSSESLMAWAADSRHGYGVPQRLALGLVHSFNLAYCKLLNSTRVHNQQQLLQLVFSRPPGTPLITVSNHMSTVDDPFLWGQWALRSSDPSFCRWTLTAKDICFPNAAVGYLFRLAKCIPVNRWGGIYQAGMDEAVDRLRNGEWVHIFPEGRIRQDHGPLLRMKWGLASLIHRVSMPATPSSQAQAPTLTEEGGKAAATTATGSREAASSVAATGSSPLPVTPVILCVGHSGFETIMPEPKAFGKRAILPLWAKKVSIVVGEPFSFDVPTLWQCAQEATATQSSTFGMDAFLPESGPSTIDLTLATGGTSDGAANPTSGDHGGSEPLQNERRRGERVVVKDEATRRLYAHITAEVRRQLEKVVEEAHERQKERGVVAPVPRRRKEDAEPE